MSLLFEMPQARAGTFMSAPEFTTSDTLRKRQLGIFIGVAVIVIGALLGFLYNNAKKNAASPVQFRDRIVSQNFDTPRKVVDPEDAWITSSEVSLESMAERMADYEKDNERLRNQLARLEDERGSYSPPAAEQGIAENQRSAQGLLPPLGKPPPPSKSIPRPNGDRSSSGGVQGLTGLAPPQPKIVRVSFAQINDRKDELVHPHINETLPAGTFVNAVMLNGLAAPTGNLGQRNPHPILLELVDYGNLPNRFSHRVKSCRVIAAGHGELSDERAYIRLERLSCVLRTGEVISKEAKGYITGEDGKNGLAGLLVTKQGAFVARSLLAGIFSGLGRAIGQSYSNVSTSALGTVESIDPGDIGKAGVAEGLSTATERVADWYLERADEVFPFVEIEAGRIVTVTFTEDIDLDANMIEKHVP